MKILITGGGGFFARGMIEPLAAAGHTLRLLDVADFEIPPHECVVGDVADFDSVRRNVEGVDAVIVNHMAPRNPDLYLRPDTCFGINVTGTANVLQACQEMGIDRVVLISTMGQQPPEGYWPWLKKIPFPGDSNLYSPLTPRLDQITQGVEDPSWIVFPLRGFWIHQRQVAHANSHSASLTPLGYSVG